MIQSMTGYGDAQRAVEGVSYTLEIRTLNNRYLKALIRLPEFLQFLEPEVEKLIRSRIERGSVTCMLRMRGDSADSYRINIPALQSYVDQVCSVKVPEGVEARLDLAALAQIPGVCQSYEVDESDRGQYWELVREMLEEALDNLIAMRSREGEALCRDLEGHCDEVAENVEVICQRAPVVVAEYHTRLQSRVQMLLNEARIELDQDSLAREIAIYAERCDVNEELARLRSHLEQFKSLCGGNRSSGRKLDFLAQEMLREANTIGSKANDTEIARRVVEIKSLIDRLKEQAQNVE